MKYMSYVGTVRMFLSVVSPETFPLNGIARRPPNPNLFLLASSNLGDEIHFKGGRFVTSQIFRFGMLIGSLFFIMISMHF